MCIAGMDDSLLMADCSVRQGMDCTRFNVLGKFLYGLFLHRSEEEKNIERFHQ